MRWRKVRRYTKKVCSPLILDASQTTHICTDFILFCRHHKDHHSPSTYRRARKVNLISISESKKKFFDAQWASTSPRRKVPIYLLVFCWLWSQNDFQIFRMFAKYLLWTTFRPLFRVITSTLLHEKTSIKLLYNLNWERTPSLTSQSPKVSSNLLLYVARMSPHSVSL